MEMAHQLIGITMPEPGISRVVAVDIAEALELAETGARSCRERVDRRRVALYSRQLIESVPASACART